MSYRAFEPNAIGSIVPPFSGGMGGSGGAGGPDRFAPKYLVGNVPAGDSATPYSSSGFEYIPDPGNGTGIAAAIALANAGSGADIWLRPGTYNLNAAGAPVAPFTLSKPIAVRGTPGTLIVPRNAGDHRVFVLAWGGVFLENFVIFSNAIAPGGSGDCLIEVSGAQSNFVTLSGLGLGFGYDKDPAALVTCVKSADANTDVSIERCLFNVFASFATALGQPGTSIVTAAGGRMRLSRCRTSSPGDYGVYVPGQLGSLTRCIVSNCQLGNIGLAGVCLPGAFDAEVSVVDDTVITGTKINSVGVYTAAGNGTSVLSLRCRIDLVNDPLGLTFGVLSNGQRSTITSSRITASTGINTSGGADNVIVANVVEAQPAQYIISSGTDEVAHNILV